MMPRFEDMYSFDALYGAHRAARRGKQNRREIIDFELNLGQNLVELSSSLKDGSYRIQPYLHFIVEDSKRRSIHALCYRDRVVQHSLCDNVVGPIIEPRLIFDNAACRKNKGTHFALDRLEFFLGEYYSKYGSNGWFLKCDIYHYFAMINHSVLKQLLLRPPFDERTYGFLSYIIDTYEDASDCGLPLGNQTSQWFALYYLDSIDRLVKEVFRVRAYVRYMDDMILIHHSRAYLKKCLVMMQTSLRDLGLSFNSKTQISPLTQGIDFLGWHFYLTKTGKIIRRLRQKAKRRMLSNVAHLDGLSEVERSAVISSYLAHLSHGDASGLERMVKSTCCQKQK